MLCKQQVWRCMQQDGVSSGHRVSLMLLAQHNSKGACRRLGAAETPDVPSHAAVPVPTSARVKSLPAT